MNQVVLFSGGDSDFDIFWNTYPRKVGKKQAKKAWAKIRPNPALIRTIIQDISRRIRTGSWEDRKYIPHPATYLNGERWEDEPEEEWWDGATGDQGTVSEDGRDLWPSVERVVQREGHGGMVESTQEISRQQGLCGAESVDYDWRKATEPSSTAFPSQATGRPSYGARAYRLHQGGARSCGEILSGGKGGDRRCPS